MQTSSNAPAARLKLINCLKLYAQQQHFDIILERYRTFFFLTFEETRLGER